MLIAGPNFSFPSRWCSLLWARLPRHDGPSSLRGRISHDLGSAHPFSPKSFCSAIIFANGALVNAHAGL